MKSDSIVIVGANTAGIGVARQLRECEVDQQIILVDTDSNAVCSRPPLSKSALQITNYSDAPERLITEDQIKDLELDLLLGDSALTVDAQKNRILLEKTGFLVFDKLVLATGGEPRRLSCPGADLEGIFTLRRFDDAKDIAAELSPGKSLVVIGGGFIGCEVAASAAQVGCEVTIVESQSQLCSRLLPYEISKHLKGIHESHGVRCLLNEEVEQFHGFDRVTHVELCSGIQIPVDIVIIGIGILPTVSLAESAGLSVENGITTDSQMRTSRESIYAIGDVANFHSTFLQRRLRLETIHNAESHATIASKSIAARHTDESQPTPWAWSDQFDQNIQLLGENMTSDEWVMRRYAKDEFSAFSLRNGCISGVVAFNRGRDIALARRLCDQNIRVTQSSLADTDFDLRSLLIPN